MITYKIGDATEPEELLSDKVLLGHCVNNLGVMGAGIAKTIATKWPEVAELYVKFLRHYALGDVQFIAVKANKLCIANIFGQKGCGQNEFGMPAIRYEALYEGFLRIKKFASEKQCKVVLPRIGAGLAGGDWAEIEKLINRAKLDCIVYDLSSEPKLKPITKQEPTFNLYYHCSNGGDGSVSVHFHKTEEEAERADREMDEGWGELSAGVKKLKIVDNEIYFEKYEYNDIANEYIKIWEKVEQC